MHGFQILLDSRAYIDFATERTSDFLKVLDELETLLCCLTDGILTCLLLFNQLDGENSNSVNNILNGKDS